MGINTSIIKKRLADSDVTIRDAYLLTIRSPASSDNRNQYHNLEYKKHSSLQQFHRFNPRLRQPIRCSSCGQEFHCSFECKKPWKKNSLRTNIFELIDDESIDAYKTGREISGFTDISYEPNMNVQFAETSNSDKRIYIREPRRN